MNHQHIYFPKNHVRFVTSSSLFDGHDAAINIMRRILQASGAEVIHLGHNRSVEEVVRAAIQEDVQGIAVSSYQGGHVEYFKYMYDLLQEWGASHIRIYGGGGGVIIPKEIKALHDYGIAKIFSPEDGRLAGLQGMINQMLRECDTSNIRNIPNEIQQLHHKHPRRIASVITYVEEGKTDPTYDHVLARLKQREHFAPVLGITGTGGAGKSSLTDEIVRRFLNEFTDKTIAILSVDPTRQRTGGALLGDRIRMNAIHDDRVYMRSLATRESKTELSDSLNAAISTLKAANFDLIIIETSGIGQGDAKITTIADITMYVMTSEFGAPTQLEKIEMLDFAHLIAINKFERRGSLDALQAVKKQYQRNRALFHEPVAQMPVYGTIASQFNDKGTNTLFKAMLNTINVECGTDWHTTIETTDDVQKANVIIPVDRTNYMNDIVHTVKQYNEKVREQSEYARQAFQLNGTIEMLQSVKGDLNAQKEVQTLKAKIEKKLTAETFETIASWNTTQEKYAGEQLITKVRGQDIVTNLTTVSLSGLSIPRVSLPTYTDWGEIIRWTMQENVPGKFPFTAGVFAFKRSGEDPKRQFAGEGTPDRTNRRFHYLSKDEEAKRLSTAFDSVTLYGENPDYRPDIYGKIGESGVNVCTLDDMKRLYAGFDLCEPSTSVSMTINGPAPILLATFLNVAIDQQMEKFKEMHGHDPDAKEAERLRTETLEVVRGTVQADILKEDQGQNTCVFSTEFALRMMGDIQQYFIDHKVNNYYSVSISGYHIAEAGANPITQLAFTLANGFTYVEYYLSRGMAIDDFAPHLSFFFSNGLDPEYTVLGRVARKIWAVVMRDKYGANERSQKLKYHIQTSGRSLHAQEMAFNDIRTTLQALMAMDDNCNSLHTNAYDEAVTTPTEESVRRAMAIQMIITKELGLAKNENSLQGSFIIEQLTALVEEAVLQEFDRLHEREGVLGAMETQYQRSKIQEESLYYETKKHNGEHPIIGVNTYQHPNPPRDEDFDLPLARASKEEKETQIKHLRQFEHRHRDEQKVALSRLQSIALSGGNIFSELLETVKYASLGQITTALYEVGGKYRRNM